METGEFMQVSLLIAASLGIGNIPSSFFYSDQNIIYVHSALKSSRLLDDMASRGIKYVDCYGVDNVLVSSLSFKSLFEYFLNSSQPLEQ